jgi:hypothetical protein
MPFSVDHDDEIVGVADKAPVAQAVLSAFGPPIVGSHLFLPLPTEMFVQR